MQFSNAKEICQEELALAIEGKTIRSEVDLGVAKILCVSDAVSGDFIAVSTSEGRCAILH